MDKKNSLSIRDFLIVAFKRKKVILGFLIGGLLVAILASILVNPYYIAESKILIKPGRKNFYNTPNAKTKNSTQIFNYEANRQINSEIQILKSQELLENIVDFLGPAYINPKLNAKRNWFFKIINYPEKEKDLKKLAVFEIEKNLEIENIKDSDVIRVLYSHENKNKAAIIVNSIIQAFLEKRVKIYSEGKSYEFFQTQSNLLNKKVRGLETTLNNFKRGNSITSLAEEQSLLLKEISDLRAQLNQTMVKVEETQKTIIHLKRQILKTSKTIYLDREYQKNFQIIGSLEKLLLDLQIKGNEIKNTYTDKVPFRKKMLEDIEVEKTSIQKSLIRAKETSLDGKYRSGANVIHQNLENEIIHSEVEFNSLLKKKEIQEKQLKRYNLRLKEINSYEMKIRSLEQRRDVARSNYEGYLEKYEESRMTDAMDRQKMTNVKVIDEAKPPVIPQKPNFIINFILSTLIGLVGGISFAYFLEYMQDNFETNDDIESFLNLPVLESVPFKNFS